MHCNDNPIYVFQEKEMPGVSPVCEGFTYIFRGPAHIFSCSIHRNMNVGIWAEAAQFLFWECLCRIFGIVGLQCGLVLSFVLLKVVIYPRHILL